MKLARDFPLLILLLGSSAAWTAERPNLLLIVSEDNGPELGCYGDPYAATPVLDRLASEGVRFERAYVPQAGCSQSRAALLTGLFPHQNGQIGLATWKFRLYRDDQPNLVRRLRDAGYRTGIIGKLHINPASAFPFDVQRIPSSNFKRQDLAAYAKEAEAFFAADDRPFFLSVNYPDAHRPFLQRAGGLPKQPLTGRQVKPIAYFGVDSPKLRDDVADYYNCLSRLDSLIGDLLSALERSGKSENTILVYLGDHGADLLRGKRTSYEGGLRIPLIVRWPGLARAGLVRSDLVSTLDLAPTFLEAAKAEPIANLPGQSLAPLMREGAPVWRKHLFTEYHLHSAHNFYPQRTVRNQRFKLIQNLLPGEVNPGYDFTLRRFFPGLKTRIASGPAPIRTAYQRMRTPPEFELYDLEKDPFEFEDLASHPKHAETLRELKGALKSWRVRTRDPLLDKKNLLRLKAEVEACFVNGKPEKGRLKLSYDKYFFASR